MTKSSRYRLSQHEEGSWNVIDNATGGPVEVLEDDVLTLLYRIPKNAAEEWLKMLELFLPKA